MEDGSRIEVDPWTDRAGRFVERHPRLMRRLGDWETRLLRERTERIGIDRPVYIAGLARSGSTILLELLSRHPDLAAHRYRDFPALHAPVAWNWFVDRAARPQAAAERAHKDRIRVTPESPEAFEEVLWMAFHPGLHEGIQGAFDERHANPAFETFYRDHIRKLLWLRGRPRYLAKGNYNLHRLAYLAKLFPGARFLVPVREPLWHVASLVKQHRLFSEAGAVDGRVRDHLRRSGHFEFGLDRRVPRAGEEEAEARIAALWAKGDDAAGYAAAWAMLYGRLLRTLSERPALAERTLIVRYEDLCATPGAVMARVLDHCELAPAGLPEEARGRVAAPDYYAPAFSQAERDAIHEATRQVAGALGYG